MRMLDSSLQVCVTCSHSGILKSKNLSHSTRLMTKLNLCKPDIGVTSSDITVTTNACQKDLLHITIFVIYTLSSVCE